MLKEKWYSFLNEIISSETDSFFKEWPTGWYEGYSVGEPSTNNGLEPTNRFLKEDKLDTNRLGSLQFLNKLKTDVAKTWSTDRNTIYKELNEDGESIEKENLSIKIFYTEPNVQLSDLTDAF